jgi:hypothetical protein
MSQVDEELVHGTLQEINRLLRQGMIPVHNGHLRSLISDVDVLDLLLSMRLRGLISGDLITVGQGEGVPHKLTNIRLTYVGLRQLQTCATQDVRGRGSSRPDY